MGTDAINRQVMAALQQCPTAGPSLAWEVAHEAAGSGEMTAERRFLTTARMHGKTRHQLYCVPAAATTDG